MQDALANWMDSDLFDDEQRLVIAYAQGAAAGAVADELFQRAVQRFGEKGVVEMTALIAFFSFWALFLNATRAE